MAGRLVYGKRFHYPHMLDDEKQVWEKYMDENPGKFESVDYDFRVGIGAPVPPGEEKNYSRMITMLSQKRIDVIGWNGDDPTIIEVKTRVGLGALGQVLGYKTLFIKEHKTFPKPELLIVCSEISRDDKEVLEDNKVPVSIV